MSSKSRRQKFDVGDCVETSKGEKCIIRFIGRVNGLSNNNIYGIEYIDGTIGEHNGQYKGKKYFIGLPKRCSFIKYDEIRRKTKYFNINSPNITPRPHLKKSNSAKNKSKSIRSIHSNNIFTNDYIYKSHTPKYNKKPLRNSKRKSLPTKLNEFNNYNKKLKNRSKNKVNLTRRSSASNKNKNKYLLHLEQLKNDSNNHKKQHQKQICNSSTNVSNIHKKVKKYNNGIRKGKNSKTRTIPMHNALKTNTKIKVNKVDNNLHKSEIQKRRNATAHLEVNNCKKNRSKSIGSKQGKNKKKQKKVKLKINIDECSRYKHERIHFSQMDLLQFVDGMDFGSILKCDPIEEKDGEICYSRTPKVEGTDSKRKNARSTIILSQDSLNEYHLKRNLVIGDIYVGNKYLLKNGKYGICLYVGPVHWIDYGKITVENEYIGIALLQKGEGRHDGEYKGKRYFECESRGGIFVKRNKLWKDCGHASPEEMEEIRRKKRKRGGLLYDQESDISDLSDNMNNIEINSDESDYTHSGHSDFDDNNSLNMDDIDDIQDSDIVSYIDLFTPPTVHNDIIITPKQYLSDNDNGEKELKLKVKVKTKKKSKAKQSRSVTTLKGNKKSVSHTVKNKTKKSDKYAAKSSRALQKKMEKFGFKNRKNKSKKWQSQTPKVGKNHKIKKRKESKTKRKKRAITLEDNDEITDITKLIKSNANKNKMYKKHKVVLNEMPNMSLSESTKFPFVINSQSESIVDESMSENNDRVNEYIIDYKPVLTKKRSRRNGTPIVSLPNLIGTQNFMALLNENINDERNGINDFNNQLTIKSLTPLPSQD